MVGQGQRRYSGMPANPNSSGGKPQMSQAPHRSPAGMNRNVQSGRTGIASKATHVAITASFNPSNHQTSLYATSVSQGASESRPMSRYVPLANVQRPIPRLQSSTSNSVPLPDYGDDTNYMEGDGSVHFPNSQAVWQYMGKMMYSMTSSMGSTTIPGTTYGTNEYAKTLQPCESETGSVKTPTVRSTYQENEGHRFLELDGIEPGMILHADDVTAWRFLAVQRYTDNRELVYKKNLIEGGTAGPLFSGKHYDLICGLNPDGTAQVVWFNTHQNTGLKNKSNEVIKVSMNVKMEGNKNYVKQNKRVPDSLTLEVKNDPKWKSRPVSTQVLTLSTISTIQMTTRVVVVGELNAKGKSIFQKAMNAYGLYIGTITSDRGKIDLGEFSFLNAEERVELDQTREAEEYTKLKPSEEPSSPSIAPESAQQVGPTEQLFIIGRLCEKALGGMIDEEGTHEEVAAAYSALQKERENTQRKFEETDDQKQLTRADLQLQLDDMDLKMTRKRLELHNRDQLSKRARAVWEDLEEEYKEVLQKIQSEGQVKFNDSSSATNTVVIAAQPISPPHSSTSTGNGTASLDEVLGGVGMTPATYNQLMSSFGITSTKRVAEDSGSDTEHRDKKARTSTN
ncbi:hypothetical protein K491DRAFT_685248 [Lophiostoma macrostomum CBS 122681]|uniref:Uncharacterized protein n=1 Tax=Lophiostoma macrostomum CBS 122681 TaxID=1314788 RepID=A0A6A6SLC1_9PLEO|nr:hypothetical protein K491DRAFT_685248 [Lophiostoma macrostomum CBS 122681]